MSRYAYTSGEDWNGTKSRHSRFVQLNRWKLQLNSQMLSLPIHIAFFLFGAGLVISIWNDDVGIGIAVLAFVGIIFSLYLSLSLLPIGSSSSPFGTPLSLIMMIFSKKHQPVDDWGKYLVLKKREIDQAHAIAWLVANTNSKDEELIFECIQAIAGLPECKEIQDILNRPVRRVLSAGLRKHMGNGGDEKMAYLHAVLRVLFTSSSDFKMGGLSWEGFLENPDEVLCLGKPQNMWRETYTIGQCVRARVFALSKKVADETLFGMVIPILIKSSEDDTKRQLERVLEVADVKWRSTHDGACFVSSNYSFSSFIGRR